jgi:hypothetical protein
VALAAALLAVSCAPPPNPKPPSGPIGIRQPLRPGYWQGTVGETLVDFRIDQVLPKQVFIRISGNLLRAYPKEMEKLGYQSYFYDRPTTCRINVDGYSFECRRYRDMHIDNNFLCGNYTLANQTYHPCLAPKG